MPAAHRIKLIRHAFFLRPHYLFCLLNHFFLDPHQFCPDT